MHTRKGFLKIIGLGVFGIAVIPKTIKAKTPVEQTQVITPPTEPDSIPEFGVTLRRYYSTGFDIDIWKRKWTNPPSYLGRSWREHSIAKFNRYRDAFEGAPLILWNPEKQIEKGIKKYGTKPFMIVVVEPVFTGYDV